jgi:thiosulfate/3-mercaptopyruvate sulfurtransferase
MKHVFNHLIDINDLLNRLKEPDMVLIDCRFDLKDTDWGYKSYLVGHIPGAVYAHLDDDLSSSITPQSGRHPLPNADDFSQVLRKLGVNQSSQIVAYDTSGGAYAARFWWMLRYFGHMSVAVLNGGYTKWESENYPIASGPHQNLTSKYQINIQGLNNLVITIDEVWQNLQTKNFVLLDARSHERYCGEVEPIDAIAGHIPGAINRFHGENLKPDMTIKAQHQLQQEFKKLLQETPPENVVVYCGSGVTSCLHILAMEYAGLSGARLYPGSWSEWIRNRDHPIDRC